MYSLLHDLETGAVSDRLVCRDADGAMIPADPENADWQAYVAWRADGNEPAEPEPVAGTVPASISDRQFAQALAGLGVITRPEALAFVKRGVLPAALQAAIDAIPDEDERFVADIQVSGATVFERAHPSTLALAHALGWSDAQMDDLWRAAIGRTTSLVSGGAAPGGNGIDGNPKPWARGLGGSGSGGAAGNAVGTVAGGKGGNGAACGAAGGGGGGSTNGAPSGAGGDGGRGEVWIIARG